MRQRALPGRVRCGVAGRDAGRPDRPECRQRDEDALAHLSSAERAAALDRLGELHLRKIDLAHEVLIINPGGYVGESTCREIAYARQAGKPVRSLEPLTV
ncbi:MULTISPECIES: hypothetical protein [unclassified Deinococcus]|uniref:hypothetical protein n=1 Tax=unclassified Deinococcus TaxID=2623546 RepID=UPI001C2FAD2C|nr:MULTISPECIES: hypothetical protein [unclassified Deinococcus]MDK2013064.1 hypothetical protein [Deinococcus sp. 43]